MRYRPRVYSYCCEGRVLHTYRVKDQIADLVHGEPEGRQKRVNRAFERIAGRMYEKNVTAATGFDRFISWMMWGTTKFIPLLFELLESVASDCEAGYFLDIPVGTGVFTAGEYSLQPNLEFIAADYNRRMLESAYEKVIAEDYGNVMLVRTDVRSLPFVDGTFTGVLTMNGFGSFPEPSVALDELVRVLKPNGKLAGSMYARGERFMTDILLGRVGAWLGMFFTPRLHRGGVHRGTRRARHQQRGHQEGQLDNVLLRPQDRLDAQAGTLASGRERAPERDRVRPPG